MKICILRGILLLQKACKKRNKKNLFTDKVVPHMGMTDGKKRHERQLEERPGSLIIEAAVGWEESGRRSPC